MFGLKVMLYANGMGPIKEKNLKKVERVLNKVDLITLRENTSLEEIKRCNIVKPKVIVTADPAFNLVPSEELRVVKILKEFDVPDNKKIIAVSIRGWEKLPHDFEQQMANALDCVADKGYFPLFIPMQFSRDIEISRNIASKMKFKSSIIEKEMQVSDMLAVIGKCDISCGMRLHMLIFSSVMNVPMVGIAYDPKIKGFMEYMGQNAYVSLEKFDGKDFVDLVLKCALENEKMKKELCEKSRLLKDKASENALLAIELLNS